MAMGIDDHVTASDPTKRKEDWLQKRWRPLMAGMYLVVCVCDFVLFPILWGILQILGGGQVETQWMPITLQGAGLFHMSMGAVLGIAAYGRTQEKLAGRADDAAPTNKLYTSPASNIVASHTALNSVAAGDNKKPAQPAQPEL